MLEGLLGLVVVLLAALFVHDRWISRDNVLRNFPVVGHLRYLIMSIGPELRQYVVASNNEELPFNRDEREWIHRSADGENNYSGFGTDDQVLSIGYPVIKHATFSHGEVAFSGSARDEAQELASARILGETHDRPRSWRPPRASPRRRPYRTSSSACRPAA